AEPARRRYAHPVEVADGGGGTVRVHHQADRLRTRTQGDASFLDRCPGLPTAGVRDRQRSGLVDAIYLDVELAARAGRRDAHVEVIGTSRRDGHGIVQPLAGKCPGDVVPSARIAGSLDVDPG